MRANCRADGPEGGICTYYSGGRRITNGTAAAFDVDYDGCDDGDIDGSGGPWSVRLWSHPRMTSALGRGVSGNADEVRETAGIYVLEQMWTRNDGGKKKSKDSVDVIYG